MPKFNLIEESWVPIRAGNELREVGLAEALLRAHKFERLEDPSPLVEVALLRVLLAVLHRALDGPRSEDDLYELFEAGRFPEDPVIDYLDAHRERFWLFHPEAPFWQIPDLPKDDPLPWTRLRSEFASGNNPTLFSHVYDDAPPSTPLAEAVRSLAAHQTFAPGGLIRRLGVGSCVAAPLTTAAAFIAEGKNLFETLTFALGVYRPDGDRPFWEEPPLRAKDVSAAADGKPKTRRRLVGRTRVYTWMSRGVRLLPDGDGMVRYIAYGPGVHPEGPDVPQDDPFLALTKDPRQGSIGAVRLREDRAFWRDFTALFPGQDGGASPGTLDTAFTLTLEEQDQIPLTVAGQVTDRAKVLEVRRERYPLPRRVDLGTLPNYIENALKAVEDAATCLRKGTWVLAARMLSESRDPDPADIRSLQQSFPALRHYYYRLGAAFPNFLLELNQSPDTAFNSWRSQTLETARESWNLTRQTLGTEPRTLKAVQEGERTLATCLRKEEKNV